MNWYSVFIRSYADSNGDGIGDIAGLIASLDRLQDLGIEGLWLLPVHPSPSYHKYDVTDYFRIDSEYGTLADFRRLVKEAHQRNMRVIIDLVVNHTSELHPWFKRALKSKKSHYRDYYVWKDARYLTTEEQQHWHTPATGPKSEMYYGLFWKGMPDLNYDHLPVRKAVQEIADYWLDLGVDGFRLDAAMHIYPPERNEENIRWWKEFRAELDATGRDYYLVGEITEGCSFIAPYLKKGLHAAFNFELAEHLLQAVLTEQHHCLIDWYAGILSLYTATDRNARDAIFLSNHDQTRVATRLNGDPRKIKLAAALLLTLPGDVFIYYGEELGMPGEKPDEHLREPYPWSWDPPERNTRWLPARHTTREQVASWEEQQSNPESIYHHYRRLLHLRKKYPVLVHGKLSEIQCDDASVIIFQLYNGDTHLLILHNLSALPAEFRKEGNHNGFSLIWENGGTMTDPAGFFRLRGYGSLIAEVIS